MKPAARRSTLTATFSKRFYWYVGILTVLSFSKSEKIQPSWQHTTSTEQTTTTNETTDNNETFIYFEEGEHFPTINFPFGNTGGLVFPIFITAYLFLCLTIVCDFFLVPCIQTISARLEWSLDIAGATLMAAASSSPELFVNILATFVTKNDVGVGTVLGTGLFALLLVPALCILISSSKTLKVDYWPIMRDSFAYFVSMVTLSVILRDSKIYWYEAASLILIYFLYLIVLYYSDSLRSKWEAFFARLRKGATAGRLLEPLLTKPGRLHVSMSVEDVFLVLEDHAPEFCTMARWPSERKILAKIEWVLMWPIITLLRLTIPTFLHSRYPQLFVLTFAMCVAWIGVLCYGISWMITVIGNKLSMPETVMGLTLIAAGMSIPESISGVIVANQGYGTMALCNALGSNTFAILMCLGIPWLINILVSRKADRDYMVISSGGLEYSAMLVVVALLIFFGLFVANRFRLKRKSGWLLVLLYLIFIAGGVGIELKFFWNEQNKH